MNKNNYMPMDLFQLTDIMLQVFRQKTFSITAYGRKLNKVRISLFILWQNILIIMSGDGKKDPNSCISKKLYRS